MVLPIRDRLPTYRTAWGNRLLLLANLLVFIFAEPWGGTVCQQEAFFLEHAAIPAEINTGEPLDADEVAASTTRACNLSPVEDKPVYLSILTSMFLHAGWAHLLGNLLFLWIFGDNVEDRFGHLRYLGFYVVCGVIATLAFTVPAGDSPVSLVGASGAIAGVLGAYFVLFPHSRVTVIIPPFFFLPFRMRAILVLGMWFIFQLLEVRVEEMAGGGVAYLAHVAGFLAGVILTYLYGVRPRRTAYRY